MPFYFRIGRCRRIRLGNERLERPAAGMKSMKELMGMQSQHNRFRLLRLPVFIYLMMTVVALTTCSRTSLRQILLGEISVTPGSLGMTETSKTEDGIGLGDRVLVEYSGRVEGESPGRQPAEDRIAEFVVGERETLPALEKAVIGMRVDETKRVKVPAAEAFGPRYEGLEMPMPKSVLPPGTQPVVGDIIRLQGPAGHLMPCTIVGIAGDSIRVDMNHPLAGKNLVLNIRVAAID